MFNIPGLPDFSKIQPMLEDSMQAFKKMSEDIALIQQQQSLILEKLLELEEKSK